MVNGNQARPTVAEIDGGALAHNFAELTRVAGERVGVLPVLKSDGYGHGLVTVARVLREAGAERFAVATASEGEALRAAGVSGAILVLGGVYPEEYPRVVEARLTAVVWDAETAAALAASARAAGRVVALHVKVDTGMSRLGVMPADAQQLLSAMAGMNGVTVEGLLTHFTNAESVGAAETLRQLAIFEQLVGELEGARLKPPLVHVANSAATLTAPRTHFDLVRPGLALYGVYPSEAARARVQLRPVMRFVTGIVALRTVAPGTGVSYGWDFVATRPTRIATLPVGYADGYPRRLSSRGVVVVGGRHAPVVGRVCMDQTMIDVTEIADAQLGDEVVLWGGPLPVEEVSVRAATIPYELLVRVGPRVPRVVV